MFKHKSKKAQQFNLMSLVSVGVGFVILGIVLSLCASLLKGVGDTSSDSVAFFGNQSLTWAGNNTPISLVEGRVIAGSAVLYNDGVIVNLGSNYSINNGAITITNYSTNAPNWITDKLNLSYSYNYGSVARNQTYYSTNAILTMSSYQVVVAFAMVAAIITGIILLYFRFRE